MDEPLAVEGAGHRLQEPDATLTVLHQLVVGRQDARYPPLHRQRGNTDFHLLQHRLGNKWPRRASGVSAQFRVVQKVEQKLRVELITRWKRD